MAQENLINLINRLESVAVRLETIAIKPEQNGYSHKSFVTNDESLPQSIVAFDDLVSNVLNSFVLMSAKLHTDVKFIADLVKKIFDYERSFLVEASKCVQPSTDVLTKFYQLFTKFIEDIANYREKNRKSEYFNHFSAISESIGALSWIAIQPAPGPYVKEMSESAQFYTNRVLKDYKEKDAYHASWVKLWLQVLSELQGYVKQYHTTGVVWNSQKKSSTFDPSKVGYLSHSNGTNGTSKSCAPPPPPMPNFTELFADDSKKSTPVLPTNALFAEINKGGNVTSHLKKVSDDQKTHKNPALRTTSVVSSTKESALTTNAPIKSVIKPPVFELEDKKWKIEYQNKNHNLLVDQTDLKHTVYIYQCKECTITVKGKVNSILIDSCQRVGLLFDDVLSTVEFINSNNVQMQVLGRVPTVTIEKTDNCQVYLSKNSLDTEIVSSKSSAMNILVPNENGDEYFEHPVPEQFKTVIDLKRKKLLTHATESC